MQTLICVTLSLPPGVRGWLRLLLVALPELFYLSFWKLIPGFRAMHILPGNFRAPGRPAVAKLPLQKTICHAII